MSDSIIKLEEKVENTERKFGAGLEYYPAQIILEDGTETWAMFTKSDIDNAIERAKKNKEDIPKSVWQKMFG